MALENGSAIDLALTPFRVALSKPARRAYITTALFLITSLTLLFLAVLAYALFYLNYVPQTLLERVVHLQFGDGPNPHGTTSLSNFLVPDQPYDISLHLVLPRSPPNLAAGNFMLDLALLSPTYPHLPAPDSSSSPSSQHLLPPNPAAPQPGDILARSRRPAILTYASSPVEIARGIVRAPFYVLGMRREEERLEVPMFERVRFERGWRNVPRGVRVEILIPKAKVDADGEGIANLEVYDVSVRCVAKFQGIRWLMYNHRLISLFLFTTIFYLTSLITTAVAWAFFSIYLFPQSTASSTPIKTDPDDTTASEGPFIKSEPTDTDDDEDDLDLSDTPRTFPTLRGQPPLRYTAPVKDDPDFKEELLDDAGRERRRIDSGIGTSLEEGPSGGVQRRRSRGGGSNGV